MGRVFFRVGGGRREGGLALLAPSSSRTSAIATRAWKKRMGKREMFGGGRANRPNHPNY